MVGPFKSRLPGVTPPRPGVYAWLYASSFTSVLRVQNSAL